MDICSFKLAVLNHSSLSAFPQQPQVMETILTSDHLKFTSSQNWHSSKTANSNHAIHKLW
jgi:hypothetical protein